MNATAVILLCALACPVSMALMMLFMRKNHGDHATRVSKDENDDRDAG